jgi:hypothetical protein
VIGRYLDEQHPREVVLLEVDGSYIARLVVLAQSGLHQEVVEFTRDDIANMIANAPGLRRTTQEQSG